MGIGGNKKEETKMMENFGEHQPFKNLIATLKAEAEPEDHYLPLLSETGTLSAGHFRGVMLLEERDVVVFLTEDRCVLVYDGEHEKCFEVFNPVDALREWLSLDGYLEVMRILDEIPVIEL
jgi:hypothetical protein